MHINLQMAPNRIQFICLTFFFMFIAKFCSLLNNFTINNRKHLTIFWIFVTLFVYLHSIVRNIVFGKEIIIASKKAIENENKVIVKSKNTQRFAN